MGKEKEIFRFYSEIRQMVEVNELILHSLILTHEGKGNFLNSYLRNLHFNFGWK